MNYSIIIYIIGMILKIEAVFMALPAITALIYQETSGVAFLITIALCLVIGLPLTRKKPTRKAFYTKEGFVTVALSWIVLSIIGAIPFVISRSIPNPVDALFETVSGFTTTGASILSDVEALPHCMLMWRSFTHWIGGMGVLPSSTYRRLSYESYESGESRTICKQACAKSTVNCQNSVFYLFRNDSDSDPASSGRWYAAV